MTRSERIMKMLDLIYERPGELTRKELSKLCGISERGIYRDLHTLRSVGVSVKFSGGGYRVGSAHWHYILEQRKLAAAAATLIGRGLKRCKDEHLIRRGEEALKILGGPQA